MNRGTLSPMNPLINEFQISIHHTLENLHVIQSTQVYSIISFYY